MSAFGGRADMTARWPWPHVKGSHGFDEQIFGAHEQIPERGQTYLSAIGLKVMWEKQRTSTFSYRRRVKRPSFNLLCQLRP